MSAPATLTWDVVPPPPTRRGGGRLSIAGVNWRQTAALIYARPHEWCRVEVQGNLLRLQNAQRNLQAAARETLGRAGWEIVLRGGAIYARYGGEAGTRRADARPNTA